MVTARDGQSRRGRGLHVKSGSSKKGGVTIGPWTWPMFLSGLSVFVCCLPNSISFLGLSFPLAICVLVSACILINAGLESLNPTKVSYRFRGFGFLLSGVVAMICPLVGQGAPAAATLTAFSFALSTLAGWLAGRTWWENWSKFNWVDFGLIGFVVVSATWLFILGLEAGSISDFHRRAVLPWGGSNYVAGVLVVCGLALWSRRRLIAVATPLSIVTCGVAVLTLSRGAFIALGAGMLVLLWNHGRTSFQRFFFRCISVGLIFLGTYGMQMITAQRSVGGYDPESNVEARRALFGMAWHDFLSNPIFGTGWLGIRTETLNEFGVRISFAHNVFLSFMQIGGVFGVYFLFVLINSVFKAWRGFPPLRATLAAGIAISLSDPFFESPVAALIMWLVLGAASGADAKRSRERVKGRSARKERVPVHFD